MWERNRSRVQELAAKAEDERATVLATLTPEQWRAIRRRGQEAHLLTVAESAPSLLAAVIDAACQPTRRRSERPSEDDDAGGGRRSTDSPIG